MMGNIGNSLQKSTGLVDTFNELTKWDDSAYVLEDGNSLCVPIYGHSCVWVDSAVMLVGKADTWSLELGTSPIYENDTKYLGLYARDDTLSDAQMVFEFLRAVAILQGRRSLFIKWLGETEYQGDIEAISKFEFAGTTTDEAGKEWFKLTAFQGHLWERGSLIFELEDDEIKVKFAKA